MLNINLNSCSTLFALPVALASAALLSSPVLFAKQSTSHVDEARVTRATPVYNEVRINQPQEECWFESIREPVRTSKKNSKTPEIFGALIGAAIGHQFGGSKRSQNVAAAAGAVLGTSVGHDWDNKRNHTTASTKVTRVERCETVDSYHTEQRLSGYEVAYRYNGDLYHTFTQDHPGDTLRVNVSVSPAE
ncbi:MAG: hypothetical protein ACI9J2_001911 [Saprospiraceae bacterium]|jgi:uncharacterized protein YcfJ